MEGMDEEKVKHIRNYARVRKMILDHYAKKRRDSEAEIERLKNGTADKIPWQNPERRIAELEERLRGPDVRRNGRLKYLKGTYALWEKSDLDRLDAADKAGVVTEITFKIAWKHSRMWGMCPSCETWVRYDGEPQDRLKFLTGSSCMINTHYNPRTYASGCGYCKRSTVMSDGIQCPAIDRLIIEHAKCWKCYAVDGRSGLPTLSFGGKGAESLRALFKGAYKEKAPIPGFEWEWQEGKQWDYIHIRRKYKGRRKG